MKKIISSNYIGRKYGRLTVKDVIYENKKCWFICDCDCGNETKTYYYAVLSGGTESCGCYRREILQKLLSNHNKKDERLYIIWKGMRYRCNSENSIGYKNYGMRGIKVCTEWEQFQNFCNWAYSNGYEDKLTLERTDPNGDYCPKNCCWIERKKQALNKRNTVKLTINNATKTLSEWCNEYNINYSMVYQRIFVLKWDIEKALTKQNTCI